jgi:PAS domain S-box-containing protein
MDKRPDVIAREASALEALRASEARFSAAFAASPIPMAITTLADGRYVEVNEAFERQIGYNRLEIHGKTSLEIGAWPTPADRVAVIAELQEHKSIRSRKTAFRTKSGKLITTLYSASVIEADGRPCVLAAILDITAQRLAEDALRESEAKFRVLAEALVEHSPFGILVGGPDHLIRFCNPAFERMFLYSADEVVGRDPDELVGLPDDAEAVDISRRVLSGETVRVTAVRRRKDGSRIRVDVRAIPLFANDEFIGCFGIYQDISEAVTPRESE